MGRYVSGLCVGLALGLPAAWIWRHPVAMDGLATLWPGLRAWLEANLGLSLLPFGLTLAAFALTLGRLRRGLAAPAADPRRIAQADHLSDLLIGLFFGIGVLWTAIGMRSALIQGLGGGAREIAAGGPAGLLERLVQGGLLTALTTTVVGGAGGYAMRLVKAIQVGPALRHYYQSQAQGRQHRLEGLLGAIRDRLPAKPTETR